MGADDKIHIENLRVQTVIGVPEQERSAPQEVAICVTLVPERPLAGLADDIGRTIDYFALGQRVETIAAERPRKLIETLAEDLAETLLREFPLASIVVEVKKFVLENADHVAVRLERRAR